MTLGGSKEAELPPVVFPDSPKKDKVLVDPYAILKQIAQGLNVAPFELQNVKDFLVFYDPDGKIVFKKVEPDIRAAIIWILR